MEILEAILIEVQIISYLVWVFVGGCFIGEFINKPLKIEATSYETDVIIESMIARDEYQVYDCHKNIRYHIYTDKILHAGDMIHIEYTERP